MERFIYKPYFQMHELLRMAPKFSLKLLVILAMNPEGLTYRQVSAKTGFHLNTISRYIGTFESKGLIDVKQQKSINIRGKKWVNIVKLRKELLEAKSPTEFFQKVARQAQLKDWLSDEIVN